MNLSILKKKLAFLFVFTLLLAFFIVEHSQSFSLEAIMNYAFPSDLIASPQGDSVAWVFNWQGRRNIWIAKGPEYRAQQLTQYSLDDGQELGQLAFNSEGTIIVYVRGGSANRAGE